MAHEILIVDDEPDIRAQIEGILEDEGFQTRVAHNSDTALAAFRARRPSLVILDIWLQNSRLDGLGILGGDAARGAAGALRDDLRPRHHRDGGAGHPAGRLRLHREAVQLRPPAADRLARAGSGAAASARTASCRLRAGAEDGAGRQLAGHGAAPRRDRARGADRQPRAHHRPRRLRQGGGGAHDPRPQPPRRRALRGAELRDAEPGALRGGAVRRGARLRLGRHGRAAPACWSARMAAPCCWTRRRTCRSRPRARSSAPCRSRASSASAAPPA